MPVNRRDLAQLVNKKLNLKNVELVEKIIESTFNEIEEQMYQSKEVSLNFGRWVAKLRPENKNPRTGEQLGPMFIPKFTFGSGVRNRIKSKRADYYREKKKNNN